jgi:uncharacterized protein (TIGR02145 family)
MKKIKTVITLTGFFLLLFSFGKISGNNGFSGSSGSQQTTTKSTQTTTKSKQTTTKSAQTKSKTKPAAKPAQTTAKKEPAKAVKVPGSVTIGTQIWAEANLNVSTFRNGDTIPEAKTNQEWVSAGEAGKPAWCYYNNNPATGQKYGKLYNWYAVNDPRELAPAGWALASEEDWAKLVYYLGGPDVSGTKMKSSTGWGGDNGTNESGFNGLPGGYRVENGLFMNLGNTGTWWSVNESKSNAAFDHYLVLGPAIGRSNNSKQRGESVRCILKNP